ncbi:hypothetical protein L838_2255 [Mycobacterium avium MAV_120709_2344]|nr:hypothetical protein L838_2255 [Mycobacterium avium MAV_120709_2344]
MSGRCDASGRAARLRSCRPRRPSPGPCSGPNRGTLWSPGTDYRPVSRQRSARAPGRCSPPGKTAPGPRRDRPPCGANPYVFTPY